MNGALGLPIAMPVRPIIAPIIVSKFPVQVTTGLSPSPAPVVNAPGSSSVQQAPPAADTSSIFSSSTLISGVPDVFVYGGAALLVFMLMRKR